MSVLLAILLINCGGGDTAASALLLAGRGGGRANSRRRASASFSPSPSSSSSSSSPSSRRHRLATIPPLPYATSNSVSDGTTTAQPMREMALQLMEENAMPPPPAQLDDDVRRGGEDPNDDDDDDESSNRDDQHPPLAGGGRYDDDRRTPVESEFACLVSNFLSYTERDIRSMTTTSNAYLGYRRPPSEERISPPFPAAERPPRRRTRTREDGIRYRALYSGVQSASSEPEIIRAFTILFEDYLPIRIAGRRIYGHLTSVMEEVRMERDGEIFRAIELCPDWDDDGGGGETSIVECARGVWDAIMDEVLLADDSLESPAGVVSLSQLIHLGVDRYLIEEGVMNDGAELEGIVRATVLREKMDAEGRYAATKQQHPEVREDAEHLDMTFPTFVKVLYSALSSKRSAGNGDHIVIRAIIQKLEQRVSDHRMAVRGGLLPENRDVSTLLAAKAVRAGSAWGCEKRARWSDRFDEYVSTFQLWERRFLSNDGDGEGDRIDVDIEGPKSRRFEILRGCFVGARNKRNVAALKIVYMDYAALRIGGDLIFQLMKKYERKIKR